MQRYVALVAVLCIPALANGWGGEGHQIVAIIAERHLTPAAEAGIHELLGPDSDISDGEVASWADEVRRSTHRSTADWHYVNIPIEADGFDEKRDGRNRENVVDKIADQAEILADKARPADERTEALKFVVHLVGDLHQPLHAGDRGDKGGNACLVFMPESKAQKASNLHSVWDGAMLRQWLRETRVAVYADTLDAAVKPKEAEAMADGSPVDWANESHDIARDIVYEGVPAGKVTRLTKEYVEAARPVTDRQLTRRGMRLAAVLNKAFGGPTTRPAR